MDSSCSRLADRSSTEDLLPEEIAEAIETADELAGRRVRKRARGWRQSPEARRAVSDHAVATAIAHFEADRWHVEDVGAFTFFDLDCTKDGRSLHVEVKGTVSAGEKVLLTRNEVTHARTSGSEVALFIVAGVELGQTDEGAITAEGGQVDLR